MTQRAQQLGPVDQRAADQRRGEWIERVRVLVEEVAGWGAAEGWEVVRGVKKVRENYLGVYEVPELHLTLPKGELHLDPIGVHWAGASGQVRVEALPTLAHVRLKEREEGGGWEIVVGANIPLRRPWCQETFVQLVNDLLNY